MDVNNLRLSDDVIGQIAKLVQAAILTGTDVVDWLRQVRLSATGDTLRMDDEYIKVFEGNIQTLLQDLEKNSGDITQ